MVLNLPPARWPGLKRGYVGIFCSDGVCFQPGRGAGFKPAFFVGQVSNLPSSWGRFLTCLLRSGRLETCPTERSAPVVYFAESAPGGQLHSRRGACSRPVRPAESLESSPGERPAWAG